MRVFLAICEHGSVRQAAGELGLNPSTVSRRLAGLEDALSTKLFERHPAGLRLTPAGEEVEQLCQGLERGVQRLQRRVAGHDQRLEGTVRITSAEVIAKLACRFVRELQREHPAVTVDLTLSDQKVSLERHEVDVALRVADQPPENLVGKRVGRSGVGLFASRAYLGALACEPARADHRFVEWPSALRHKPAFVWLDRRFPDRAVAVRVHSAQAALDAVRAGLGVSLLGLSQALDEPELVQLDRLPATCATSVWILTHPDIRKTARVRAAMDHMSESFARHQAELGP